MEPFGLIASALSVAEIATRVGSGCRHLQKEFSGALEHVDNISQQTSTIELAIREICSILDQRPQTFPSSFGAHLSDSTSAVRSIVRHIQDHVQLVRADAETSKSKAKFRHLRKSAQITGWGATLTVQTQALMLLLQVAQLHSNNERNTLLEEASSKKLFEKASSMSARLTKSSRELDREGDITKFSFDSELLESKVYRRVFESFWIREVSTALKEDDEPNSADLVSTMSISSNSAIASEGDRASSSGWAGASHQEPENIHDSSVPECSGSTALSHAPPTLEISASHSSDQNGEPSRTSPPSSMLATTISIVDRRGNIALDLDKDKRLIQSCTVSVVVDGVGEDYTNLVIHEASDHYQEAQEAILQIRNRLLLAGRVDPDSYSGVPVSSTIETSGQSEGHRFPLTPDFLAYAENKMKEGIYDLCGIVVQFPSPAQSKGTELGFASLRSATESMMKVEATNMFQTALSTGSQPRHFKFPHQAPLPFESDLEYPLKGGFSSVFKITYHPEHHNFWSEGRGGSFAVKRLHSNNRDKFEREVDILESLSNQHEHLTNLLATYEWRDKYHLLFPWAEGNLQDFWRSLPSPNGIRQCDLNLTSRMLGQCVGLADGLKYIHGHLNGPTSSEAEVFSFGRHGDIKPQNILWFTHRGDSQDRDVLKISDFGLAESHSSSMNRAGPERRGGTEAYGAPELTHHPPEHRLSSAYDIWSLGCVLLEFACWLTGGREGLKAFKISRYKLTRRGTFFEVKGHDITISSAVTKQFQVLRHSIAELDSPLPEGLGLFLDIVESCFEIDERKRPSAAIVASKMQGMHAMFSADRGSDAKRGGGSRIVELG